MFKRGIVEGARGSAKYASAHQVGHKGVSTERKSLSPKHREVLDRLKGKVSATKTDLLIQDLFSSKRS